MSQDFRLNYGTTDAEFATRALPHLPDERPGHEPTQLLAQMDHVARSLVPEGDPAA